MGTGFFELDHTAIQVVVVGVPGGGGGYRSKFMVLCSVSMLYCTTWWKHHRLLFLRNPRRIVRERLVWTLHPIPVEPAAATLASS